MKESTIKKKICFIIFLFILGIAGSIYLLNKKYICKIGYFITKRIQYLKKIKNENFLVYYKIFLDN